MAGKGSPVRSLGDREGKDKAALWIGHGPLFRINGRVFRILGEGFSRWSPSPGREGSVLWYLHIPEGCMHLYVYLC